MVLYGYDKEEMVMGSKKHIKRYAAVGALSLLALSGIAVYNSQHNVSAATASYKNVQESNSIATQRNTAKEKNLLTTYGETFTRQGTCINLYQLKDANTLAKVKKQYNSITHENMYLRLIFQKLMRHLRYVLRMELE